MPVLVQKFGGTSLATPEARSQVVAKIIHGVESGHQVVVVVSAMGRSGDPYATDTLLALANSVTTAFPERELDLLLSCGEIIAAVLIAAGLNQAGYKAQALTGSQAGIITDGNHGQARIAEVQPARLRELLGKNVIPVVAGFQGMSQEGNITTLGRGGSDITAAALGVALHAHAIEIYTDVDGIKTADPLLVKEAKTLPVVTYNEIVNLAYEGAKVIHPRAVEIASEGNICIYVKSTFASNDDPGTLVTSIPEISTYARIRGDRPITGITYVRGITQITLWQGDNLGVELLDCFRLLAEAKISIDFINLTPEWIAFTVAGRVAGQAEQILSQHGLRFRTRPNCAKVAAVGAGMTGVPGIMAQIVGALSKEGIAILQSADSYSTIWCLVEEKDLEVAVRALHDNFRLGE